MPGAVAIRTRNGVWDQQIILILRGVFTRRMSIVRQCYPIPNAAPPCICKAQHDSVFLPFPKEKQSQKKPWSPGAPASSAATQLRAF